MICGRAPVLNSDTGYSAETVKILFHGAAKKVWNSL